MVTKKKKKKLVSTHLLFLGSNIFNPEPSSAPYKGQESLKNPRDPRIHKWGQSQSPIVAQEPIFPRQLEAEIRSAPVKD